MRFLLSFLIVFSCFTVSIGQNRSLASLKPEQKISGFTTKALYLDAANLPIGARFINDRTGFTFDLLQIESVPQTFIWVHTPPVSDKGEPHTQEHLLITKGNKGHELNTREGMSLAVSNAFTSQDFTAYDFYTSAGPAVFYNLFEEYMDALLHPNYSDEEVRREVRNWGISEDAATKQLRLEEKGTVYNEMKTSMNHPDSRAYDRLQRLVYGEAHPLSYNSGGSPEGIRNLSAADIKKFHDENYHLANMGAITALPKTMKIDDVLQQMDGILKKLQPENDRLVFNKVLPAPQPAPAGTTEVVPYPTENPQEPGMLLYSYPADLTLSAGDDVMLSNFLSTFAGDASTNLYKMFVDSKTRGNELDAQAVYAYLDNHAGQPIIIGFGDVSPAGLSAANANIVWQKIQGELHRIAALPAESEELKAFNARFANNLTDAARGLAKFTNTPPQFGGRNTGDAWYQQLREMDKISDFRKSIVAAPQLDSIRRVLASGRNFWGDYFQKWKLFNSTPYSVMTKADTHMLAADDSAAQVRRTAKITELKSKYHTDTDDETMRRYKGEYDANTLELEKAEQAHTAKFIDNPPLTLDDQLDYSVKTLKGNIPWVASVFNNMSGATTGLALNLNKVPEDKLVYLAMLPGLLTQTGLYKNGVATTFEEMSQLQRQQILSLVAYYSNNSVTGRNELVVKGAGNNAVESERAVDWMNDVLQYPYWKTENLPRIRDLVNQYLNGLRKEMQNSEESWVSDPGQAYRVQDNHELLATSSFLTRRYNIQRLKWMLTDGGSSADRVQENAFLDQLANTGTTRADRAGLLDGLRNNRVSPLPVYTAFSTLSGVAKTVALEAIKDLEQTLGDIPDQSMDADWRALCAQMKRDLAQTPEVTLQQLQAVRETILHTGNARVFTIGSQQTQTALQKNLVALVDGLSTAPQQTVAYRTNRVIEDRFNQRNGTSGRVVFGALVNPNATTGVFMNTAKLLTYRDTDRAHLTSMLAGELFGGGGAQSVYTKSIGAGLSYSTGVGVSPASGLMQYYAERTPLLPQTIGFIINEIKKTPNDPAIQEYIIALSLSASRAAGEYEGRGEGMAADFADGTTPDLVKNYRLGILKLRNDPQLMTEVFSKKDAVYEKIFPGYGTPVRDVPGGSYFVIGNDKQFDAYESYLQAKDSSTDKLARLYPRDYWME